MEILSSQVSPGNGAKTSRNIRSHRSGFQDGGKFTAIISIKVQDREKLESIKAEYIILYCRIDTTLTDMRPLVESYIGTHQRTFGSHGNRGLDKSKTNMLAENETTIHTQRWTGSQKA